MRIRVLAFLIFTAYVLTCAHYCFAAASANQAVFYVASGLPIDGDGSIDSPFASLKTAQNAVRGINRNMTGDIVVYLREGTHCLTEAFTLDEQDGGSNGYFVRYQSYPGERAIISGGEKIEGWVQSQSNAKIWEAPLTGVPYVLNMDVNRTPARRAQSEEMRRVADVLALYDGETLEGVEGFTTAAETLPSTYINQQDIQVRFAYMWRTLLYNVDEILPNPANPQESIVKIRHLMNVDAKLHTESDNLGFWIENAFEELDTPGEFYYDKAAGRLYYLPRADEDMTTAEVYVPILQELLKIYGTSSRQKVKNLILDSITFEQSAWLAQAQYGLLTGQTQDIYCVPERLSEQEPGRFFVPAAIQLQNTDGIIFRNNILRGISSVGIGLYQGAYRTEITGNQFYDLGDSAITVGTPYQAYESTPVSGYNLAEGKPATDNSTDTQTVRYFSYLGPSAAIDPNQKTGWAARDVDIMAPWWQVDLLDEYEIDRIEIDARKGTAQTPTRRNFEILASNDPDFNTYTLLGAQGSAPFEHEGTRVFSVEDTHTYRYVRIRKTVREYFWLNEVRIINESMEFTPKWQLSRHNVINNNVITRAASYDWGVPGIHSYFTEDLTISHNDISELPYSGICSGWGWNNYLDMTLCRSIKIINNRIENVLQKMWDGGGIYTLGPQYESVIRGNYIGQIDNHVSAIYLDTGSGYFKVSDNVIEDAPFSYTGGWGDSSRENFFFNNYSTAPDGQAANLAGDVTDGLAERTYPFVVGNYPRQALDIVKTAGLEPSYRHLKSQVPAAAFPLPEVSKHDNVIHVTNYGSMNDQRFLYWFLRWQAEQAEKVLALTEPGAYEQSAKDELADYIALCKAYVAQENRQFIAGTPLNREEIIEYREVLREKIRLLGESRRMPPLEDLLSAAQAAYNAALIGTQIGQHSQAAANALGDCIATAQNAYDSGAPLDKTIERQRLHMALEDFNESSLTETIYSTPLTESAAMNVAENKTATSPFTRAGALSNLVDGDYSSGNYWYGIDSNGVSPGYFTIDLQRKYPIESIVLFDRIDAVGPYRSMFRIYGSNDPSFTDKEELYYINDDTNAHFPAKGSYSIDLPDKPTYRYIRYQANTLGVIYIREIEIWARQSVTEASPGNFVVHPDVYGVSLNRNNITIHFSEKMHKSTLNNNYLKLIDTESGAELPYSGVTVSYEDVTLTGAALEYGREYAVKVLKGVKNGYGASIAEEYVQIIRREGDISDFQTTAEIPLAGESFGASLNFYNQRPDMQTVNFMLAIALYENNELKRVETDCKPVRYGMNVPFYTEITMPDDMTGYRMKIFSWDSMTLNSYREAWEPTLEGEVEGE